MEIIAIRNPACTRCGSVTCDVTIGPVLQLTWDSLLQLLQKVNTAMAFAMSPFEFCLINSVELTCLKLFIRRNEWFTSAWVPNMAARRFAEPWRDLERRGRLRRQIWHWSDLVRPILMWCCFSYDVHQFPNWVLFDWNWLIFYSWLGAMPWCNQILGQ